MSRIKLPFPRSTLAAIVGLILILGFNVCWRWHTIGSTPIERLLPNLGIQSKDTEPLDCDEAVYAYMGRRMLLGDVLYRDLAENKPPIGYWIYATAVAIGGANEFTIRVMPIPFVLTTIGLVWWIGLKLSGPTSACVAALIFAASDTDPYVFGNGSNMEHFINCFSVASLAFMVHHVTQANRRMLFIAGVFLSLAALVKQVAIIHGLIYIIFLMRPRPPVSMRTRLLDMGSFGLGFLLPCLICLGVLLVQGAYHAAYDDIVRSAWGLATTASSDANAPSKLVRWLTGNADPQGGFPWPFGKSTYLVWWGVGLWPLWVASLPATVPLVLGRHASRSRRLLAAWAVGSWFEILLPGLFWQHYYLLAVPGMSLAVAIWLVDSVRDLRAFPIRSTLVAVSLLAAMGWSGRIQIRDYWLRDPIQITTSFKGGRQWVDLRAFGRAIKSRAIVWDDPRLFVWGWQSPLFIYAELDGVSREVFVNDFLRAHADDNHPIAGPRIERMLGELRTRPPSLILCGYPPFPALRRFLDERYLLSRLSQSAPDGRGLWVDRERYSQFEMATGSVRKP